MDDSICFKCGAEINDSKKMDEHLAKHARKQKSMMKSRAYKSGMATGKAIMEMANLMYQKNTKGNFLAGLEEGLNGRF